MKSSVFVAVFALASLAVAASVQAAPPPADPAVQAQFLADNVEQPGVIVLPGLQYRVLKSGPADGSHPTRGGEITVRYEGRFIDGKVFNTSPDQGAGSTIFPLQKLIPGWIAGLQLMRPGDVWVLYVPAYLAYGAAGKDYIPPGATLIFKIELLSVSTPSAPSEAAKPKA
jgi:peptidylprolyl isomerase/FKBP-type peptidyl-prolyl cis-trans isomerase FklB